MKGAQRELKKKSKNKNSHCFWQSLFQKERQVGRWTHYVVLLFCGLYSCQFLYKEHYIIIISNMFFSKTKRITYSCKQQLWASQPNVTMQDWAVSLDLFNTTRGKPCRVCIFLVNTLLYWLNSLYILIAINNISGLNILQKFPF